MYVHTYLVLRPRRLNGHDLLGGGTYSRLGNTYAVPLMIIAKQRFGTDGTYFRIRIQYNRPLTFRMGTLSSRCHPFS